MTDAADRIADVELAATRLTDLITDLDDTGARAASVLPGWSRGHVLTHVANFSEAMTRQVREALAGRRVEFYDGGRPARDQAIEDGAGRPAAALVEHVGTATAGLLDAWKQVGPDDWQRPVTHRNGDLAATVYTGWRELTIHTSDLGLGIIPAAWPADFCLHLLDFLRPRVPDGIHLVLETGTTVWETGTGTTVTLRGALQDLTTWMAGRTPEGSISGSLPELAPWPS